MSRRSRQKEQKKKRAKLERKRKAKSNRVKHDPARWEEKKRRKHKDPNNLISRIEEITNLVISNGFNNYNITIKKHKLNKLELSLDPKQFAKYKLIIEYGSNRDNSFFWKNSYRRVIDGKEYKYQANAKNIGAFGAGLIGLLNFYRQDVTKEAIESLAEEKYINYNNYSWHS